MEKQPAISVIVPVYKAEKYLHRCVDSLLAQTFSDFEVLLVDDGSPDRSGEICDEYAKKDSRVRVFHKENGGVSSARQCGIDNAQGEYTIHADPDDWVEPEMLEALYKKAKEDNADMVICDFYEEHKCGTKYIKQEPSSLNHEVVLRELFQQLHGSCCNKLVRRACYNNIIQFNQNLSFCEDLCFNTLLLSLNIKVAYVPRAFYYYVQDINTQSLTRISPPEQYEYLLFFLKNALSIYYYQKIEPMLIYAWAYKSFIMRAYSDKEFKDKFRKRQICFLKAVGRDCLRNIKVILLLISCWSSQKIAYWLYKKLKSVC